MNCVIIYITQIESDTHKLKYEADYDKCCVEIVMQ